MDFKAFIIAALLTVQVGMAARADLAQTVVAQMPAAPTLADHMEAMKNAVETILAVNPNQLASVAPQAAILRENVLAALSFVPSSIEKDATLDAAQKYRKTLEYQRELDKLIPLTIDLENALLGQNATAENTALQAIAQLQKDGEALYK